jgi:hypothetical protein
MTKKTPGNENNKRETTCAEKEEKIKTSGGNHEFSSPKRQRLL